MNIHELIYMYHSNCDEVLEMLIEYYKPDVDKMVRKHYLKGFRQMDEEDVAQVAHLQMIEALETYREEKGVPFLNYYLYILKNSLINMKRSLFAYGKENDRIALSLDQRVSEENANYLSDYVESTYPDFQAGSVIQKQQAQSLLLEITADLTLLEKQIFAMRQVGFTYREIAKTLGIAEKKVDNTLAKIRKRKYDEFR